MDLVCKRLQFQRKLLLLGIQCYTGIWGVNLHRLGCGGGEKERRAALSSCCSPWVSVSFCTLELWRGTKLGVGFVHSPHPEPLEACWALLKPPKQMVVDQSFKDPRMDILQPPLLTDVSA